MDHEEDGHAVVDDGDDLNDYMYHHGDVFIHDDDFVDCFTLYLCHGPVHCQNLTRGCRSAMGRSGHGSLGGLLGTQGSVCKGSSLWYVT